MGPVICARRSEVKHPVRLRPRVSTFVSPLVKRRTRRPPTRASASASLFLLLADYIRIVTSVG